MTGKPLLDTNVLIYAFAIRGGSAADRRPLIAEELLRRGGTVSVQMLTEFSDVLARKHGKSWAVIAGMLEYIRVLCGPPIRLTEEIHARAIQYSKRYGFRIYDSLVIAAARQAGCDFVYTEDLQHGQTIDGLRIENPFLSSPTL